MPEGVLQFRTSTQVQNLNGTGSDLGNKYKIRDLKKWYKEMAKTTRETCSAQGTYLNKTKNCFSILQLTNFLGLLTLKFKDVEIHMRLLHMS